MYGHLSAWFYQALAGINIDSRTVGFGHTIIKPQLLGNIKWVRAKHESTYGTIKSAWEIQGDKFTLKITVPVNTTATVYVPEVAGPIQKGEHVRFLHVEDNYSVYDVESGTYEFVSQLPPKETK